MDINAYYAIAANQIIRRVPPPFPDERLEFYRLKSSPTQVAAIPEGPRAMILQHRAGELVIWGESFGRGTGYRLEDLIDYTLHVYRPEIEGTVEVLGWEFPGDLVIRPEVSEQDYLQAINDLVAEAWPTQRLSIQFRDVERTTAVFTGRWVFNPVDATSQKQQRLEIYGADLDTDRNRGGGGGSGGIGEFVGWLGRWIGDQVLFEAEDVPDRVSWRVHARGSGTDESRASAHSRDLVLKHIQEQTGLIYSEQLRRVRRLFVELI